MEQHEEQYENETTAAPANRWILVATVVALAAAGIAFGYGYHQQGMVQQLASQQAATGTAIEQTQSQVSNLTAKLGDLVQAQRAAAELAAQQAQMAGKKGANGKANAAAEKRYRELASQLAEEQKQLKVTQDQVAQNRADLEGNLTSTRDELNGSIARTHEELVALERRGERSYYEFDLAKSKQFQRVGPLSLELRKADTKHKRFDLALFVDDNRLEKQKVNLYEPIWIHSENDSQPVQIVVNRIRKDAVHGYVSAPKFMPSERAAASGSPTGAATGSDPAKTPDSSPQPPAVQPDEHHPLPRQPDSPDQPAAAGRPQQPLP